MFSVTITRIDRRFKKISRYRFVLRVRGNLISNTQNCPLSRRCLILKLGLEHLLPRKYRVILKLDFKQL